MSFSLLPNTAAQLEMLHPQVRLQEEKQTRKQNGELLGIPLNSRVIRDGLSLQMRSSLRFFRAPDLKLVIDVRPAWDDGPGIPLRIYIPHEVGDSHVPVLFYIHGGGFVAGNLDDFDLFCRTVCVATGCCVISVEYRLAPEHPYPAASNDCYSAAMWIQGPGMSLLRSSGLRVSDDSHCIGGESAGANLALSVCLRSRSEARKGLPHPKFCCLLLGCPMMDSGCHSESYSSCGNCYSSCTSDVMKWCWAQYCASDEVRDDPLCSPLKCEDWTDLPDSIVHLAEFDPLREEGRMLHANLSEFGGHRLDSVLVLEKGVEHCWYVHPELERSSFTLDEMARFLRTRCGMSAEPRRWLPKEWGAATTAYWDSL